MCNDEVCEFEMAQVLGGRLRAPAAMLRNHGPRAEVLAQVEEAEQEVPCSELPLT